MRMHASNRSGLRTSAAIIGLTWTLLLGTPATSAAVFPGADGRIAFVASGTIYSVLPDGTDMQPLGRGDSPAWSPDGQQIVFLGGPYDTRAIFTMNADGSNVTAIAPVPGWAAAAPAFAPGGDEIVYSSGRAIRTVRVDGTDREVVITASRFGSRAGCCYAQHPRYSPDGRRIAFVVDSDEDRRAGDKDGVWTMNRRGAGLRQLTQPKRQQFDLAPDYSPDGRYITFGRARVGYFEMRADGSRLEPLSGTLFSKWNSVPRYAPSGTRFVAADYVIKSPPQTTTCGDIYTAARDGTDYRRVTYFCDANGIGAIAGSPAWQPGPG